MLNHVFGKALLVRSGFLLSLYCCRKFVCIAVCIDKHKLAWSAVKYDFATLSEGSTVNSPESMEQ